MILLTGIGGLGGRVGLFGPGRPRAFPAGGGEGGALAAVWCIIVLGVIWPGGRTTLYKVLKS